MSTTPVSPDPALGESATACLDRGRSLRLEGRLEEALECFQTALRLDPESARAHAGHAATLGRMGLHGQAIASYWEALRLDPGNPRIYSALGNRYLDQGRPELTVDCYRQALAVDPEDVLTRANLLFALNFDYRPSPEEIFREHAEFGRRHGTAIEAVPAHPGGKRPLRIGYVSGDFCSHPVSSFFEPVLACHSRDEFEIVLYSNTSKEDAVTERLRRLSGAWPWRNVTGASDEEAAQMVRDDGIDILVDLAGHTGENRLDIFAHKPAPVQATWLGYPNTTGIPAFDYRLTDAVADPPGLTDHLHTERLVRLPRGFLCYLPPREGNEAAPEVAPAPSLETGAIAFGSCSKPLKWNPEVIRVWAAILRRIPGSRLLLHHSTNSRDGFRTFLYEQFFAHGVAPDRIEILGSVESDQHWNWFHEVDLALDPFPYNGTSGTCETLWMGVPVIALAGRTHVSRVGASILSALDLESLIAATPGEYVDIAVRLASDPGELARLRAGMRERMMRSPLMDAPGFTRSLEDAYRWMWEQVPAGQGGYTDSGKSGSPDRSLTVAAQ
jgi:protein O-GlcNAc transferase